MRRIYFLKPCERCGTSFKAYPDKIKYKSAFRFCSQDCYHLASRTLLERACKRCGKTFRPRRSQGQKFCSHKCYYDPPTKEQLQELYLIGMLSIKSVSKSLELSYLTVWRLLRKYNIPIRTELHASFKGGKPHNYVNGLAQGRRSALTDKKKDRDWRNRVFKRDKYTCRKCGATNCELNADHIKRFSEYPELRYKLSNGQTLCVPCHKRKTSDEGKRYWKNQYTRHDSKV